MLTPARVASRVRLWLPWTRRAEMDRLIGLVAEHHNLTPAQAFALMYADATPQEQELLDPYRPEGTTTDGQFPA